MRKMLDLPYDVFNIIFIVLGLLAVAMLYFIRPDKFKALPFIVVAIMVTVALIGGVGYMYLSTIPVLALFIAAIIRKTE